MLTLWDDPISGNGYKVRMILHRTGTPFTLRTVDILKDETHTPEFLALNPNGKIPTVVFEDGDTLWESNALLLHFAEGTPWLPTDARDRARVYQWLFFEQYNHEPYIAVARFRTQHLEQTAEVVAFVESLRPKGYAALDVMERHLTDRAWFVGDHETAADLALYAYTHVSDEGGFSLAAYPHIRAWMARVEHSPGHRRMGEA